MRKFNEKGMAIFGVIGVVLTLLIFAGGLIVTIMGEKKLSKNYVDSTTASYVAECGIEQALFEVKSDIYRSGTMDNGWLEFLSNSDSGSRSIIGLAEINGVIQSKMPRAILKDVLVEFELTPFAESKIGWISFEGKAEFRGVPRTIKVTQRLYAFNGHSQGLSPAAMFPLFVLEDEYVELRGLASDMKVKGSKIYMKNSPIELSKMLVNKVASVWDWGYGPWGGVDLTEVDSLEGQIYQRYKKLELKEWNGIPIPTWRELDQEEETYDNRSVYQEIPEVPNLHSLEEYKALATKKFTGDETVSYDLISVAGTDFNKVVYPNVKKFYGWGDWRNAKKTGWLSQMTSLFDKRCKADDPSKPIQLNGIYYVEGDVYIEGFFKGVGSIVSSGNIYIGGDLVKWGSSESVVKSSALSLIAPQGKVVFKPHPDKDWCASGLMFWEKFKDRKPYVEAHIFADGGVSHDADDGFLKKSTDLILYGGMSCRKLNRDEMVYDVKIVEDRDALDLIAASEGGSAGSVTYNIFMGDKLISWRQTR